MDEFFARNRLSAYIDGELSDAEMAEVARAIEEQPELREAYLELKAAVDLLRQHGPVQAPPDFHRGVMRRVEGLSRGRSWLERLLGPVGRYPVQGLGVAVVAAAVLLLVFRGPLMHDPTLEGMEASGPETPGEVDREAAVPGPTEGDATEKSRGDDGGEPSEPAQEKPATEMQEKGSAKAEQSTKGVENTEIGTRGTGSSYKGSTSKSGAMPIEELLEKEQGTYIPDWDKESAPTAVIEPDATTQEPAPEAGAGSLATSPFAYRLTPSEPDALRKLVAMAEKLGGGAYSASGDPHEPYILTVERNYEKVVLQIPASRLESVEPYLRSMGGVVTVHADQDRLYAADAVHVTVEVQYQP